MSRLPTVTLLKRGKYWYMKYRDPVTGREMKKSTGEMVGKGSTEAASKRRARKVADLRAHDLANATHCEGESAPWEAVRRAFFEAKSYYKRDTKLSFRSAFNNFERYCHPKKIGDLTTRNVDRVAAGLRAAGNSESTVASVFGHLRTLASWAVSRGYLARPPVFDMPKKTSRAKGRAVRDDEFEAMLLATPQVMGDWAPEWRFFLEGLRWSGLRLEEALAMTWEENDDFCHIRGLGGPGPRLFVPGEVGKSSVDGTSPVVPQLLDLLRSVPPGERRGWVFKLHYGSGAEYARTNDSVGPVVRRIARAAGVVSYVRNGKEHYCGAHDLRRSFGTYWAHQGVGQSVLKELMRHADIKTTMEFYVDIDAGSTTKMLCDRFGNNSGNIRVA